MTSPEELYEFQQACFCYWLLDDLNPTFEKKLDQLSVKFGNEWKQHMEKAESCNIAELKPMLKTQLGQNMFRQKYKNLLKKWEWLSIKYL